MRRRRRGTGRPLPGVVRRRLAQTRQFAQSGRLSRNSSLRQASSEVSTAKRSALRVSGCEAFGGKELPGKLRGALQERFGKPVRLTVTIRETTGNTARDRAAAAVGRDEFVRDLVENFDATIVESSIKPVQ